MRDVERPATWRSRLGDLLFCVAVAGLPIGLGLAAAEVHVSISFH